MSVRVGATGRMLSVVIGAAMLTGCATDDSTGAAEALPAGSCPSANPARDGGAMIDWVPFVVVGHTMYRTVYGAESVLAPEQVGDAVATVACRIAGTVGDPDFRPRDGDAAYLPVGTSLHAVVGEPVAERLAAREDGVWRLFEAVEQVAPEGSAPA